jgi:hypothetical protein
VVLNISELATMDATAQAELIRRRKLARSRHTFAMLEVVTTFMVTAGHACPLEPFKLQQTFKRPAAHNVVTCQVN